jgi:hypothetical protein
LTTATFNFRCKPFLRRARHPHFQKFLSLIFPKEKSLDRTRADGCEKNRPKRSPTHFVKLIVRGQFLKRGLEPTRKICA